MRKRWVVLVVASVSLALLHGSSVGAVGPQAGVCHLDVSIDFISGTMRSIANGTPGPGYTMEVDGADGTQDCFFPFGVETEPVNVNAGWRSTSVTATPITSGDLWTCEAVQGSGLWRQSWDQDPPAGRDDLQYIIAGSWGSWTMIIHQNLTDSFLAVIELTFANPGDANPASCYQGAGVSSLELTGVQVFDQ